MTRPEAVSGWLNKKGSEMDKPGTGEMEGKWGQILGRIGVRTCEQDLQGVRAAGRIVQYDDQTVHGGEAMANSLGRRRPKDAGMSHYVPAYS